jgi:hypothetical protein
MSKSTAANAATDIAVIQTENGGAVVGGRPGVGTAYDNLTSSHRPLPDESRREAPIGARNPQPVPVPDGPVLPFSHVAWQFVNRKIQRLKAQAEGIERDLARGVMGASGQQVPYLIEKQTRDREALAEIRAEIGRLSELSDLEVRQFAYELGAR